MIKTARFVAVVATAVALYGCAREAKLPTINNTMTSVMEPKMEKIWGVASNAFNEVGDGLVPSKISDDDWKLVADASREMKERAEILATAKHIVVADANEPILGSQAFGIKSASGPAWDPVDAKTVQGKIDANPEGFRQKARVLVDAADALHRASQTKDVALFYKVTSEMDEVCDGCHQPFWGTDEPPPFPAEKVQPGTHKG
jgi:hypothetical protein